MDPLSRVVEVLQPRAVAWRVIEAHAPWNLAFPASRVVIFGQVIQGQCTIDRADGLRLKLDSGDFLLMAAPPAWTMHSADGGAPVNFQSAFDDPSILRRAGGAVTTFIAGRFSLALAHSDLLARLMLPVVQVRAREVERGRLGILLRMLGEEVLADRPGRSLVSDRLLEILLVEALRQPGSGPVAAGAGLLAGLADTKVARALHALHDDIRHAWRVGELARRGALSRSAFSARFTRLVGVSPIDYLISWRMTVARNKLVNSNLSISAIADMIGYQSASAFGLAFKKATGCSPGAYRAKHSSTDV
jgi:AraC-like DNA-binding protein